MHIQKTVLAATVAAATLFTAVPYAHAAGPNDGIEEKVRAAFADAPDMVAVARCESGYAQFTASGAVLRGGYGGAYTGIFQIGEAIHRATATRLGMDIDTVDGNIAYARHLYDRSGNRPWLDCVRKVPGLVMTTAPTPAAEPLGSPNAAVSTSQVTDAAQTAGSPASESVMAGEQQAEQTVAPTPERTMPKFPPLTATLLPGGRHAQVMQLQQMLNASGFAVAPSGPGSVGNETTYYGPLTIAALKRFQCARIQVCDGTAWTTGYGVVGPRTRAALNAAR